ncbi:hypothetical protein ABZ357_24220 [Streptomyces sp. NPDC005917]|uniref:hypothetical protein n=1 Tax=unclassified Streptomyces TaxID=2593676 RepID=UPI0033D07EB9
MDQRIVFDAQDFKCGPRVRGMAEMYIHEVANIHSRELSTWLSNRDRFPEEWSRVADMSNATFRLTPELAGELVQK